ncbi:MAG: galactokinase [Longimicrobiales bacterium]
MRDAIARAFSERFGAPPEFIVRAPGRVNLIGEHTDYNDGFVLPLAIDHAAWIALRARPDREVHIRSDAYDEEACFRLDRLERGSGWTEYVKGVAWAIENSGERLTGWDGVLSSDVPIGAGLSSSAAVELAAARAFAAVSGITWDAAAMARLAQQAENEWVGMNCGVMDQTISAMGREGHALLIDCRTLGTGAVPLTDDVVVILDTGTRRGLVDSAYNERREQCRSAAAFFGVEALRDVDPKVFEGPGVGDETIMRRARHVVTENARVLAAVDALRHGDPTRVGRLMSASHVSLRDDFEVSTPALDAIVDIARAQPGCYGARMTGGGFGGCAVALVDREASDAFVTTVARAYERRMSLEPAVYVTGARAGASVVS